MTTFVFVGNGKSDPSVVRLFGYEFLLNGDAVEVDAASAKKLASNSHFKAAEAAREPAGEKDELEAIAREYGVELDKRKSLANLRKQVRELVDGSQDGS